ncbi:AMP-binding protein [Phytohabitans aurantiacus]|uniref:AMP-binding protein n=1 Tax=Phytohabitans aurantiacus TaxID=3016789 RepID=UPI0024918040|nr:AMP-binding protein [Phytohabitans aurantiacus]
MAQPRVDTAPFAANLVSFGDRPALITAGGTVSYADLAARVAATARRLGGSPRLVMLSGANTVDAVVAYLAALSGGHPLLLVTAGAAGDLAAAYDPDVVLHPTAGGLVFEERRAASAHAVHPDLALLLSTSGSTGSPKLVRLSLDNLQANAEAIAEYLDIRPTDRAATTLPMHYCYGLSVINSHLLRGAGLILTELSVTDACFWDLFRAERGTAFAGVPYTFDLLDRIGFERMRLPHLRYVTQAGGRLAPDRVRRYAALGRRAGWDLFVMYGQTEATARMAYLPPELAPTRPSTIGVPIPGGSFRLSPLPEGAPGTGELVYSGPNVMLGYASEPADLALGRTVDELHTGDIARRAPDGLYEIVGRCGQFAKIRGLRIDPLRVEHLLDRHAVTAYCVGGDDELLVAAREPADPARVRRLVVAGTGLPPGAVRVAAVAELPRLPSGKPDHAAVRGLAFPTGLSPADDLCALYAEVLDVDGVTPDHSFVSLGGDSLSYVEMSLRLERALGHLPVDWHTTPIRSLRAPSRPRRRHALDTTVALRAVAIVLVVGTHATLFNLSGGAHLLLGVAGFNFARFHLTGAGRGERLRHIGASIRRIAVPSVAWIAAVMLVSGQYGLPSLFLLGGVFGPSPGWSGWHFWFVEALVYILAVAAALLAVPALDRLERRYPYGFPIGVLLIGLLTRYDVFGLREHYHVPSAVRVFWLFAIGWAAAKATTGWQRAVVTLAAVVTVPGYFDDPAREAVVLAGLVLLIWVPSLPSAGVVNRVAGVLAAGSLYIYLTHWQVYPRLDHHNALLAVVASLAVGLAYAALAPLVRRAAAALVRRARAAARFRRSRANARASISKPRAFALDRQESP